MEDASAAILTSVPAAIRPQVQIHICPESVERALSRQTNLALGGEGGIPQVDPSCFLFREPPTTWLAQDAIRRHRCVPLYRAAGGVVVAMENPLDAEMVQVLRFMIQARVIPVGASREALNTALARLGNEADNADALAAASADAEEPASARLAFAAAGCADADNAIVQLTNRIICGAHAEGASDIHLEPHGSDVKVRLRRDGVLQDYMCLPTEAARAVLSRVKVMASLDISERRKAQDGKIRFKCPDGPDLELRVATIPLNNGREAAVLRLLSSAKPLPLEALGMPADTMRSVRQAIEQPHGLILVCGPTGSGKTTTLHSLLSALNTGDRKIWTAEDPVEISQAGLSQVQVNTRIGWTFAAALRAFLRADPDVVMVGEMRDRETAATAVEASLTGHLVMSTLHTNGAAEAAIRLIDMGLDPFSSADALIGVLAQRLVRRACPACARIAPATKDEMAIFRAEYLHDGAPLRDFDIGERFAARVAHPVGCGQCGHTGYKGRVGLYEWMLVTPALRARLQRRASAEELRACAIEEGMRTLRQDGLDKALGGLTTLDQVRAVCGIADPKPARFGRRPSDTGSPRVQLAVA